ncbi:Hypothetical predicted protein [Paramuricea clavata]|uniref:Uncharacterized protein n=1 Tax=Paramuricea clavata TaxID=317549 RepID=A0A7D9ERU0_PARCT|nr:Hypothetical predicted protein [Paramuricea clavata]
MVANDRRVEKERVDLERKRKAKIVEEKSWEKSIAKEESRRRGVLRREKAAEKRRAKRCAKRKKLRRKISFWHEGEKLRKRVEKKKKDFKFRLDLESEEPVNKRALRSVVNSIWYLKGDDLNKIAFDIHLRIHEDEEEDLV